MLIDHLRGDPRAVGVLSVAAARGDALWSATPVRTEIIGGMRRGEERVTLALLDTLHWQEVTKEIADRAGQLARRHLKSHPGIDTVDFLLAATTQALAATLLTQNVKHFPMFSGLEPAYQ